MIYFVICGCEEIRKRKCKELQGLKPPLFWEFRYVAPEGATHKDLNEQKKEENASAREPSIGDRAVVFRGHRQDCLCYWNAKSRGDAGGTNCKGKDARPEASGTNRKCANRSGIKSEGENLGRYVYDSGGADLGCGVAMSDYDVRSSRCSLACPGCVLDAG